MLSHHFFVFSKIIEIFDNLCGRPIGFMAFSAIIQSSLPIVSILKKWPNRRNTEYSWHLFNDYRFKNQSVKFYDFDNKRIPFLLSSSWHRWFGGRFYVLWEYLVAKKQIQRHETQNHRGGHRTIHMATPHFKSCSSYCHFLRMVNLSDLTKGRAVFNFTAH